MILILPSPRLRKEDPVLTEFKRKFRWEMVDLYRYRGRRPPQPHMIVSFYSGIRAAGPDQGLTLHEVRAIVNLMVVRTNHKPFRTCHIHPVSHLTPPCHQHIDER